MSSKFSRDNDCARECVLKKSLVYIEVILSFHPAFMCIQKRCKFSHFIKLLEKNTFKMRAVMSDACGTMYR